MTRPEPRVGDSMTVIFRRRPTRPSTYTITTLWGFDDQPGYRHGDPRDPPARVRKVRCDTESGTVCDFTVEEWRAPRTLFFRRGAVLTLTRGYAP